MEPSRYEYRKPKTLERKPRLPISVRELMGNYTLDAVWMHNVGHYTGNKVTIMKKADLLRFSLITCCFPQKIKLFS